MASGEGGEVVMVLDVANQAVLMVAVHVAYYAMFHGCFRGWGGYGGHFGWMRDGSEGDERGVWYEYLHFI